MDDLLSRPRLLAEVLDVLDDLADSSASHDDPFGWGDD